MELEGQLAFWGNIGINLDGGEDNARIAILDYPGNAAFPSPWRVENELGIEPSRQILGDSEIANGKTETIWHRRLPIE
jgi:hypothetical protein